MATATPATASFPHLQFGQTVGPRDENSTSISVLSWIEVFPSDRYHRILEDSHIDQWLHFVREVVLWNKGTHSSVMGWAYEFAKGHFKSHENPIESINYSKDIPGFDDLKDDKEAQEKAKQKYVSDLLFSWFATHFPKFHPDVASENDTISPRIDSMRQGSTKQFLEAYLCWLWHQNRDNWDGHLLFKYQTLANRWWAPANAMESTIKLIKSASLLSLFDVDLVELIKEIGSSIEEVESSNPETRAGKLAQDKLSWFLKLFVVEYFTKPTKFEHIHDTLNNGVVDKDTFIKHLDEAIPTWEIDGREIYPLDLAAFREVVRFCQE